MDKKMEINAKELALKAAKMLDERLARELSVIDVSGVTEIAEYFVIATGTSSTHVKALCDEVEFKLKQEGIVPDHIEGHNAKNWIVMDYSCVVVHIFDIEARNYYDLERLWADGKKLELNFSEEETK